MKTRAAHVAEIVGGTLYGPDAEVDGATIDSRAVRGGELFVPVAAARDGHDFIASALQAGAGADLTARPPRAGAAVAGLHTVAPPSAPRGWGPRRPPARRAGG